MRLALLASSVALGGCGSTPPRQDAWEAYTTFMIASAKMREERAPQDAPFDHELLAQNFERIAFAHELNPLGLDKNADGDGSAENSLMRWEHPVTVGLITGGPDAAEAEAHLTWFIDKLAGLTGHPIRVRGADKTGPKPNFLVMVITEDQVPQAAEALSDEAKGREAGIVQVLSGFRRHLERWRRSERSPCAGRAFFADRDVGAVQEGTIYAGFVVIQAGLPDRLRTSCIEEELAQTMGLFNDDSQVRPSIFNDDQEFAYLTRHDELLLRILYDPRLQPGMSRDEAMPIVRRIARDLLAEG